jgi:hypothetical protein
MVRTLEAVSVRVAAERLGISDRAVRLRLERGLLKGKRQGGRWVVYLDGTEPESNRNIAETASDRQLLPILAQLREQAEELGRLRARNDLLEADYVPKRNALRWLLRL